MSSPNIVPCPFWRLAAFAGLAALCVLLGGCAAMPAKTRMALGPSYEPGNVFVSSATLPASVRRVAVLPLAINGTGRNLEAGRETLTPILHSELARSSRFELIPVTGNQLRSWTGRSVWTITDQLPAEFLARIREETGCDAVLFSQLNRYDPYPPLAVGLTLHLVEAELPRVVWAVDEMLDASDPTVATGAQRFAARHATEASPLADSRDVLRSPRRFGQYAAYTLVGTVPAR
jgi:hypothetical protein